MNFNPVLQSNVYAAQPVAKPSGLEAAVNVIGNTMKLATTFMDNQEDARIASEVQGILDFNEDLVGQNIGEAKRTQMVRERVRSAFGDNPENNLRVRGMLAQFGLPVGGGFGRGGMPANDADQRARDIDAQFSSIPADQVRMFSDVTDPDGLTTEDKAYVIREVTRVESETRATQQKKAAAAEQMKVDQTEGAIAWGASMMEELNGSLGRTLTDYAKKVKAIDPNNPQSSAGLEQLRSGTLASIGMYKQKVNAEFAAIMVNTTDPAVRTKLKADNEAILKTINDYETTFLSPTSSFDVIVQSERAIGIMTASGNIENKEALSYIRGLKSAIGEQGLSSFVNSYLASNAGKNIALRDELGGVLSSLINVSESQDKTQKFPTVKEMANAWNAVYTTARGIRGVPTEETRDTAYKSFIASVNTMEDEYVPVSDRKRIMQEFDSLGVFWDMLEPAEKEFAMSKRNQLEFLTLTDAIDGDIQRALQNPALVFNKQTGLFEMDSSKIDRTGMASSRVGQYGSVTTGIQRQIKVLQDSANSGIQRMLPYLKEEIKRDTGNDLTDEQLLGLMGIPVNR